VRRQRTHKAAICRVMLIAGVSLALAGCESLGVGSRGAPTSAEPILLQKAETRLGFAQKSLDEANAMIASGQKQQADGQAMMLEGNRRVAVGMELKSEAERQLAIAARDAEAARARVDAGKAAMERSSSQGQASSSSSAF